MPLRGVLDAFSGRLLHADGVEEFLLLRSDGGDAGQLFARAQAHPVMLYRPQPVEKLLG